MKKTLLLFMMMLLTVICTTSCGGDDDDVITSQIVGTWRDIDTSDGNEDWTFNANGKGYVHFDDIEVNGHKQIDFTYSLSGNKLTMTLTLDGAQIPVSATVSFSEDGKTLYIYQEDDEEPIVLNKIK
ncbi:hypothetical protein PRLR6025_21030 [Prevotella lacticifex]|uniref:DUF5640 domain-containing protein n=1 Tax=Prevotella lacticifex TaxID=2854755 RepID=UPI001CC54FB0|nr:DUF5640 domain-containing protein [Prevotella lacticifex]GJG68634.1 hypothetical protein PRLR6025_21030 [Prevotella lacticifex]